MADGRNGNGHGSVATIERADVAPADWFRDIGSTGLVQWGGWIEEEFLTELRWPHAARIYREMSDNDPVIGGLLTANDLTVRRADRIVKAADESPQATEAKDLCESALDDMEDTWADTQSSILSFLPYGFSVFEKVFKRCQGPRAKQPSNYSDGKIRIDHLPIRSQETLVQFNLEADKPFIHQQALGHLPVDLPYAKLLHFRTRALKGNPLGYPILRRCYTSYYRLKVIQWIESIGIERDLAGLPFARMPLHELTGQDPRSVTIRNTMRAAVKNVRRNEAEGLLTPSDTDENGKLLYEIGLLSSPGQRQFNIGEVVTRLEQRILMSALADFLMLGHEGVGSLGLNVGTAKINLFLASVEAYCVQIASQIDKLFVDLTVMNGLPHEVAPTFEYGPLNKIDVAEIASALYSLAQAGLAVGGDPTLTDFLLTELGLPHSPVEDIAPLPAPPPKPDQTTPDGEKVEAPNAKTPATKSRRQPATRTRAAA